MRDKLGELQREIEDTLKKLDNYEDTLFEILRNNAKNMDELNLRRLVSLINEVRESSLHLVDASITLDYMVGEK